MSYALLPRTNLSVDFSFQLMSLSEFRQRRDLVDSFSSGPFAMDFETSTYDWKAEDFRVRTLGLCNEEYCICIDFLGADVTELELFKKWLLRQQYIAFNALMEGGTMLRWAGKIGNIFADTYILFADLASDEAGFRNLDTAMQDLLSVAKGGDAIDEYMMVNKWTWNDIEKFDFEILGKYCALDTWGTWYLYKYFVNLVESYKDLWGAYYWDYHQTDCINMVYLQIEARWHGLNVAVDDVESRYIELITKKDKTLKEFLYNEETAPFVQEYNRLCIEEIEKGEPQKFKKDGSIRVNWHKWEKRLEEAKGMEHFNTNSTKQLKWLLFDKLGLKVIEYTKEGNESTAADCLKMMGRHGKNLLEYRWCTTKLKFLNQIRDSVRDGKIYPFIKLFATVTSRAGGGTLE